LGVTLSQADAGKRVAKHDIFLEKEELNQHIRSVTPGGYNDKISDETVEFMKTKYATFIKAYGYE
jgi:hypothetical protein